MLSHGQPPSSMVLAYKEEVAMQEVPQDETWLTFAMPPFCPAGRLAAACAFFSWARS